MSSQAQEIRRAVREYACPKCGAKPGAKCNRVLRKSGVMGVRWRSHEERWSLYRAATKEQPCTK